MSCGDLHDEGIRGYKMQFAICVMEPEGFRYAHFLYDICKYLCFGIESAGYKCSIQRNKLSPDCTNIIVGAHNLTIPAVVETIKQTGNYILLQSEIITGDSINNWPSQKSFADVYLPLMRQAQAVWTGVETNVSELKKLNVEAGLILIGYHPQMEEIHHKKNKDIDFLFCGSITPHRKKLLDALTKYGSNVVTMFDDAAIYRNDLIARARINLAPNQGPEMNHLGYSRVSYLLNNRALVVVERCYDQAMYEHCFPWAETEQWVDLCMETLRRPDLDLITEEYYERFKKIRMVDFIAPLLDKFISKYGSCSSVKTSMQADGQIIPTIASAASSLSFRFQEKTVPRMTSIIILTRNRLDYTKNCLKSIRKHTPEPHEIIFVDNGSTDGTVKWLQGQLKKNKNYRLIENKENVGVAKGLNQGINLSQGEFILFMHNDVLVGNGWLPSMLECLNHAPLAGIVGPMTNNISGPQQVASGEYQSVNYLDKYAARFREQYRYRRIPLRRIVGFCMLFRRALVEQIGMLDESFGTGNFEDDDFCLRAALAGYKNYIAGDVFIHHHGSRSFIDNKIDYSATMSGNRKIIEQKWMLSSQSEAGKKLVLLKAVELANDLYQKGKLDQAVEALINCIKVTPDAEAIYYEMARMFLESRKFPEAWEVIESMPETASNTLKGLECTGYAKEGLELDDEASCYADRMLALDERYAPALNLRGVLAYRKGEKKKAANYFKKAIDADPGYGEAYTNLGVLNWGLEKKDEAIEDIEKGFILGPLVPDHSSIYYSAMISIGRFAEAEMVLLDARRLYPDSKAIAFLYIDALIQQGKWDAAMLQIEDALVSFDLDEGMLNAAMSVREHLGHRRIGQDNTQEGTLSLCMIVKDEEAHLAKCLRSVRDIVDEMIVVDTGSTDKTMDIARVFGAQVSEFPWTGDFSAARNQSLARATGDWILILDADEVLSPLDFEELKKLIERPAPAAFSIVTRNYIDNVSTLGWTANKGEYPEEAGRGWLPSPKVRLCTRGENIYFSDPVHETLEASIAKANIPVESCNIVVHHYGKLSGELDLKKGESYYLLGRIKLEADPTNCNHIQELARQAQTLGRYEECIDLSLQLIELAKTNLQAKAYMGMTHPLKMNPETETYIHLASSYLMLERYEEALAASQRAVTISPNIKEAVQTYANCEIIAGSVDKAYDTLHGLLIKEPDYPPALLLLAIVFCLKGQTEMMRDIFVLLLNRGFNITPGLNKMAKQLASSQGKTDNALLILQATIESKLGDKETIQLRDALLNS